MPGRSLLLLIAVVGSLAFVPLASGRAASCGYWGCNVTFTVTQVPYSSSPTGNPPYLGGAVEWKITPGSVDSCSTENPLVTITGANAGAGVSILRQGGSIYVYYTGAHAGTDTVRIGVDVSACYGFGPYSWQYAHATTYGVGWKDSAPTRGYCNAASPPPGARSSATFWKIYRQTCVDDPVDESAGSFGTEVTDAAVASPGVAFAFTRSYSSGDTSHYELGYGWHEPYGSYLVVNTGVSPNTATATIGTGQQILFTAQSNGSWAAPVGTTATLSYANSIYTLTDVNHVRWQFSTSGMLTKIIDRNGETATVSGWVHWPTKVTLGNGKIINFTTDGNGRITKITLPDGRTVLYGYGSAGDLTSVTDMRGGVTTYTYNSLHQLLDRDGSQGPCRRHERVRRLWPPRLPDRRARKDDDLFLGSGRLPRRRLHDRAGDVNRDRPARQPLDRHLRRERPAPQPNRSPSGNVELHLRRRRAGCRSATPTRSGTRSTTATTAVRTSARRRCPAPSRPAPATTRTTTS